MACGSPTSLNVPDGLVITYSLVFILGYALLIAVYYRAWNAIPESRPGGTDGHGEALLSVIIPARNESRSIERCLESVLAQQCAAPFEVIVVDDHSTDDTAARAAAFCPERVRVIRLSDLAVSEGEVAFKKRAIEAGIALSRGQVIATTDADCTHHPAWLDSISRAFASGSVDMASGPVLFEYDRSLFQRFQALDFIGMIGITAASLRLGMFNLANGANLSFRKDVFEQVNGYSGIDSKASGDDMLLIYKFAQRAPGRITFLKAREACVYTRPAKGILEFVQQRLRWTSKSFSYQDRRITLILAFVYLANFLYLFNAVCAAVSNRPVFYIMLLVQFAAMAIPDYIFLKRTTAFFKREDLMRSFLPSQVIHIVYIIVIGLLGNLVKYRWKGRKLK